MSFWAIGFWAFDVYIRVAKDARNSRKREREREQINQSVAKIILFYVRLSAEDVHAINIIMTRKCIYLLITS